MSVKPAPYTVVSVFSDSVENGAVLSSPVSVASEEAPLVGVVDCNRSVPVMYSSVISFLNVSVLMLLADGTAFWGTVDSCEFGFSDFPLALSNA